MKKNTSGELIGVQMVTAADGTAFTSAVVVNVTLDNGTQALGATGSGACTHKGNGFHIYSCASADNNGDHIAFTFTGSGAIPATLQLFTNTAQTGDTYPLASGATGFAAIDTVVDGIQTDLSNATDGLGAIKAETALIYADTNELQTDWVNAGRLDTILDAAATAAALTTHDGKLDTAQTDLDTITGTGGVLIGTAQTAAAWSALEASAGTMKEGVAKAGAHTTATMFTTLTEPDDAFNGRILIFKSDTDTVALRLQATNITDYANTNGQLTFSAVTTAPGDTDTFCIV